MKRELLSVLVRLGLFYEKSGEKDLISVGR